MNDRPSFDVTRGAGETSLALVLGRVAAEIGLLAQQVDLLDSQIGQKVIAGQTPDLSALQHVDRLRQEVEGLQDFVEAMRGSLWCGCSLDTSDALGVLKLRDQALRLQGLPPDTPADDLW